MIRLNPATGTSVAEGTAVNIVVSLGSNNVSGNPIIVPGTTLAEKLGNITAESNTTYVLELGNAATEFVGPRTLSYPGKSGITIHLKGGASERIITLNQNGSIFTVTGGVTLILDNNITLQGVNDILLKY